MTEWIVGIDPGKRGAWAIMDMGGGRIGTGLLKDVYNMTEELNKLQIWHDLSSIHVFLEKGQSIIGNGGASMYTYGHMNGWIEGALYILKYRYTLVQPREWTKELHKAARGHDAKEKSLHAARCLFPNVELVPHGCKKPHDGIVDALLIAEYGRRQLVKL